MHILYNHITKRVTNNPYIIGKRGGTIRRVGIKRRMLIMKITMKMIGEAR